MNLSRFAALLLLLAPGVAAQATRDLSAEFAVPEGLEVTLWAESPRFFNPTNIDIDARGRIWVTEGVNYRKKHERQGFLKHPEGDRVMILEDADGDGACDASKVFVQDPELLVPLGVGVLGSRVVVSSSPHVFIYFDENGDDKPDRREVFLTGFGGRDHDHGVHAFIGGPDGRWYFNHGDAGAPGVSDRSGRTFRTGKASDDGRLYVGGCAHRIEPDGTELTVLAHNFRNNYELAVDSFGHVWQNENDDDGNASCRMNYVLEGGNYGFRSTDGTRAWKLDQRPGQPVPVAHWRQEDPGVVPPTDVTGAGAPTGIVVYEGDLLPERYRGMILNADSGRSIVFGHAARPDGAGFKVERIAFLESRGEKKHLFRPSDVAVGTDGAVYVSDWYDPGVGGHDMKDGTGYGRILRVAPRGSKPAPPKIDLGTLEGQVAALRNPAVNVRYQALVKLHGQGEKALPALQKLSRSEDPRLRARAVWLLARGGAPGRAAAAEALKDRDDQVRIAAFRALRQVDHEVLRHAAALARDASPAVRREVAVALRGVPFSECRSILLDLAAGYDGKDRYYVEALGIGCEGREEQIHLSLIARAGEPDPAKWPAALRGIVCRLHPVAAVPALKKLAESGDKEALAALAFVRDASAAQAMVDLARTGPDGVKEPATWWVRHRDRYEWKAFKPLELLNK